MSYIINTPSQQNEMLDRIGVASVDELFTQVPAELRLDRPLDVSAPMSEIELDAHMRKMAAKNGGAGTRVCFQGAGVYDHFIPAAVDEIASRGEYYTAYTPYQAEASQGTLQVFFEFQTLICQLTGMEVSNASLYEGGTAVSEAAFMAQRVTKRHGRIVVLGSVHPEYRSVLHTYRTETDTEVVTIPTPEGTVDPQAVRDALNDETAALIIQQPNFFGCLEEAKALVDATHDAGALAIVAVDPVSLGLLERPGDYGADIVVAEGQSLGTPLQYGGPLLGLLTCRQKHVRTIPGRLIGETVDRDGKTCYVLNLQTREQHIRRDKATSNICTNQGLLALRATIYLSLLGPQGLKELATLCLQKSHYLAEELAKVEGLSVAFDRPFFKEFTLRSEQPIDELFAAARKEGIDLGPALHRFPGTITDADHLGLVAVTEKRTRRELDALVTIAEHMPSPAALNA